MANAPLMPMATAVWLVENTTLTFNCFNKFFCYKSQNEKKDTSQLPQHQSRNDRWNTL